MADGVLSYNSPDVISSATSFAYTLCIYGVSIAGVQPVLAMKFIGITASVLTVLVVYDIFRTRVSTLAGIMAAIPVALLPQNAAYALCGLESSLYTLVIAMAMWKVIAEAHYPALLLAGIAGAFRPEGAMLTLVVIVVSLFKLPMRRWAYGVILAIVPILLTYLIHYWYYGTWLPQSAVAKMNVYSASGGFIGSVENMMKAPFMLLFAAAIGLDLLVLWVRRKIMSCYVAVAMFVLMYLVLFVLRAPSFEWYLLPLVPLVIIMAVMRFEKIILGLKTASSVVLIIIITGTMLLVYYNALKAKGYSDYQVYEDVVRKEVGKKLKKMSDGRGVLFTEAVGYIGYYSGMRVVDWPGLVSVSSMHSAVKHRGMRNEGYLQIIKDMRPDYCALRLGEYMQIGAHLADSYLIVDSVLSPKPEYPGYVIMRRR